MVCILSRGDTILIVNLITCIAFHFCDWARNWNDVHVFLCVVSWNPRTNNKLRCVLYLVSGCVWSINLESPASAVPHEPAININLYPDRTNFIHFVCMCLCVFLLHSFLCARPESSISSLSAIPLSWVK